MKNLFLMLMLLLSVEASAQQKANPLVPIIQFAKGLPDVWGYGDFSIGNDFTVHTDGGIRMYFKGHKKAGYTFSERHVELLTEGSLFLEYKVLGVASIFRVKSIRYDHPLGPSYKLGTFRVQTDTPFNLGEKALNKKVEEEVAKLYRAKLIAGFAELVKIRKLNSPNQLQKSIETIIHILFYKPPRPGQQPMPAINVAMDLVFPPKKTEKLRLDQKLYMTLQGQDNITVGVDILVKGKVRTFTELRFSSQKGVRLEVGSAFPEIASIKLQSIVLNRYGLNMDYVIGGEEVLQGLMLTMQLVLMQAGIPPRSNYSELELKQFRVMINSMVSKQLLKMFRENRARLLATGVSPQLLEAVK